MQQVLHPILICSKFVEYGDGLADTATFISKCSKLEKLSIKCVDVRGHATPNAIGDKISVFLAHLANAPSLPCFRHLEIDQVDLNDPQLLTVLYNSEKQLRTVYLKDCSPCTTCTSWIDFLVIVADMPKIKVLQALPAYGLWYKLPELAPGLKEEIWKLCKGRSNPAKRAVPLLVAIRQSQHT